VSIRLRLTLWYTALLGLTLLVFDVLLYTGLQNAMVADISRNLQQQSTRATAMIEQSGDPMATMQWQQQPLVSPTVFASQVYAQILDPRGDVLHRSENLLGMDELLPISPRTLQLNLGGETGYYVLTQRNTPIYVLSRPLRNGSGKVVGILQVGQSLADMNSTLVRVRTFLTVGSILAIVVAAAGGAFVARTTLRPIDEITGTARRIGRTQHLAERIAIEDRGDEVSRLADTFNEMLARLDRLFETQQRLIADVSHELRTPLTTIRGNLDLLKRGAIDDPELRSEALHEIESEVDRMSRMVGDLLLLAQADAGLNLQRVPVELDTLLLEVFRQGQIIAQGHVELRLGHEDQVLVMGDADRLRQLLLNLVDNAIKYTPAGGRVTISLFCNEDTPPLTAHDTHAASTRWVRIDVSDTGIGIAPADLPYVFDRFFRTDRARTRKVGGSGLGLSIARWIAEAHDGLITVVSEPGHGSTFTLWLPASAQGVLLSADDEENDMADEVRLSVDPPRSYPPTGHTLESPA
jgi:signal transduction histidine kinase